MHSENIVFVFGSNLSGFHGAGAAKFAMRHFGAVYGHGVGPTGRAYAIPTKGKKIENIPLEQVKPYVEEFVAYANDHPELMFQVTQIGCGLAGFTKEQVAPLFVNCGSNCSFDTDWLPILGNNKMYWGHI